MKNSKKLSRVILILLSSILVASCRMQNNPFSAASYRNRIKAEKSNDLKVEQKIDSLLSLMSLEEKAGQMLHINFAAASASDTIAFEKNFNIKRLKEFAKKYGIGFVIIDNALPAEKWVEYNRKFQKLYLEEARLKIPFIHAICHQHGPTYLTDATIFPHNLNIAATFDTVHAYNCAHATTLETAHLGHNFIYVPVVDLGRNPRWPRFYETFGESYVLCSAMGRSIVNGIQNNAEVLPYKVASCAKHFLGYSDPKNGWDRNPAHIPVQEIYEFFAPSFQACIDAGVKVIEANSGEVNGIPVHASYDLLTKLLRDRMHFKGVLNSDWGDVKKLVSYHGVAENEKEATYLALQAGLDCILTTDDDLFAQYTCELVRSGRIPEERLDLSVRRILRLKFDLGLFDGNFSTSDKTRDRLLRSVSQENALQAARESIVLLKNENGLLPIDPKTTKKIIVAGPNADSRSALTGGWTVAWSDVKDSLLPERVKSVYQAIQNQFQNSTIALARNAGEIQKESINAEAIIYVAGEKPYAEMNGCITDMNLPEEQITEIETAIKTKVPVLLIMVAGRPRIVSKVYDGIHGFIWAGLPGYEGGQAIAELIAGAFNPSGKLPFEYPYAPSTYMNYNRKKHEQKMMEDLNFKVSLAAFGDGLSYTTFIYENLLLSDTLLTHNNKTIRATVEVTNTGKQAGREAVLWFITDETGRITRPVRELKYFEKQELKPGEKRRFEFIIHPEKHLFYPDENGDSIIENGFFILQVGPLTARFRLEL